MTAARRARARSTWTNMPAWAHPGNDWIATLGAVLSRTHRLGE